MKRILLATVIPALLAPMLAQAEHVPSWGTRARIYDFTPYQTTRVHIDHDNDWGDRWDHDRWDDRGHKGCPPGLAKKGNGCMPPGQAKKHWR